MPQSVARDLYDVLGIARDADAGTIRDAFRSLALQYHPDRNKAPDAEQRFKEIAEAYAVLSDPDKRARYDAGGFAGVAGVSAEDLFRGIDFGDIFGDTFGDMGAGFGFGAGGLFERLFRPRAGAESKGRDLELELQVPLETVARGGPATLSYPHILQCAACHGSGARSGTAPRGCQVCGGTGRKVVSRAEDGGVRVRHVSECPACHGSGKLIDEPCLECGGAGRVERQERLELMIPAGAEEGMALRVAGHGEPSLDAAGRSGDLFVVVRSAPDPRFVRRGADLWRDEMLEVADAALGARLRVPTLEGEVEVTVPEGTQPDQVLCVRGKGLAIFGSDRRGDLNVRIRIHVPERLSARERTLYQKLREADRRSGGSWSRSASRTRRR